jgi:hypothetical protein
MSCRFQFFLLALAVWSAIIIPVPALGALSSIFGIIPPIFSAPTLLLYALPWWLVRATLRRSAVRFGLASERTAVRLPFGIMAVAIILVPAILITDTFNAGERETGDALRAEDRTPASQIVLPSSIVYLREGNRAHGKEAERCDALCRRLLYNGAVQKITVISKCTDCRSGEDPPSVAFRIEQHGKCDPRVYRRFDNVVFPGDYIVRRQRGGIANPIEARMGAGECLASSPEPAPEKTVTIRLQEKLRTAPSRFDDQWTLDKATLSAQRLEIISGDGTVLYRRTEVQTFPLAQPLAVAVLASLSTSVTYAGWSRVVDIKNEIGPLGRDALPAVLGPAVRFPDGPRASAP